MKREVFYSLLTLAVLLGGIAVYGPPHARPGAGAFAGTAGILAFAFGVDP